MELYFLNFSMIAFQALFPAFQDFDVVHDYLLITNPEVRTQARLRRRGQHGIFSSRYIFLLKCHGLSS